MKSVQTYFSGLVVLLLLLAGCAQATALPNQPQPTDTQAATLTPVPNAIETSTQTFTPIPPPTRRATLTSETNLTASVTPLASFTRKPTVKATKTITPTITGTNTLYVRPPGFGGPTWTPANASYKCEVVATYPEFGHVYTPRADFVASWKIVNTGTNFWRSDDIYFGFVNGTKMQTSHMDESLLGYTVYVGDHIPLQVHMKPPKEPGLYTTIWGLRKSNKKEFFCLFDLTIQVVSK